MSGSTVYDRDVYDDREKPSDLGTREDRALSLSPLSFPLFCSLTRYRRTGEMDRIWTIPPLFKTDEELSGRSLCLWWTRCAVRGYGGSPRPPIGRERRDREQYRHEGTNYPPTITTTIRTRPPPPSAATPRFDMKDEERWTETELAWTRTTRCREHGKREIAKTECVRERVRWKNECT